jgi:hypothetical protein
MNTKQKAEMYYDYILNNISHKLVGNTTTYLDTLNDIGIKLFDDKFIGVFPSDKIPILNNNQYVILNLDKSGQAGSHWVAVVKHNNKAYLYDSFGRKASKIIPSLIKSGNGIIVNTELDKEQLETEYDCGSRAITSLLVMDLFGIEYYKKL